MKSLKNPTIVRSGNHLLRYNLTFSDEQKYLWFRTAKVASRTILQILKENTNIAKIKPYNVLYDTDRFQDHFKFSFVRNPWDRVVSCYQNKVVEQQELKCLESCFGKNFQHFVEFLYSKDLSRVNNHFRLQSRLIPPEGVDFIGRFENFNDDLQYVLKRIGVYTDEIPFRNQSRRKGHYHEYYNYVTMEMVREKYAEDIERFGYSF